MVPNSSYGRLHTCVIRMERYLLVLWVNTSSHWTSQNWIKTNKQQLVYKNDQLTITHFSVFALHAKKLQQSQFFISRLASMSSQQGFGKLLCNYFLVRSPWVELGLWPQLQLPLSRFHWPYLGMTWSQPLCEWKQISALSLHRPRSRKIQYLAYLRDQNLALWGRWRGRGTRRGRGHGAAACWPIDTPAPGCAMGCHARSGL